MIRPILMAVGGLAALALSWFSMQILMHLFPGMLGFVLCVILAALAVAAGISIVSLIFELVDRRAAKKGKKLHGRRRAGKM